MTELVGEMPRSDGYFDKDRRFHKDSDCSLMNENNMFFFCSRIWWSKIPIKYPCLIDNQSVSLECMKHGLSRLYSTIENLR